MAGSTMVERCHGAVCIVIDDGRANVMNTALLHELATRMDEARKAASPVVLFGRQGILSAGFDLNIVRKGPPQSAAMIRACVEVIRKILDHPYPVVTVCTGHAYPVGAFLLLASDLRLGILGDWRIGLNEVAVGIKLPPFAALLARSRLTPMGLLAASTGRLVDPQTALLHGYLDIVVPEEELNSCVFAEISRLTSVNMASFAATKAMLNADLLAKLGSIDIPQELTET